MREEQPIGLGSGLAGVILVVVIAWALAAVLMLAGTLTNAQQINQRVKLVNAQVGPIDKNLAFVKLAGRTGRISAHIEYAARNLSGELTQIVAVAGSIDAKANSILGHAQTINGIATSINTTVHGINHTVNLINGNVQSISGSVLSIGASVASIHSRVGTIAGAVGPIGSTGTSINADVTQIHSRLGATLTTARAIRIGVVAINDRANVIIGLARLLKSDFDNILAGVGTMNGTATILGHANSIDCSRVINLLGPTQDCNH